jgi:hypothetical protein
MEALQEVADEEVGVIVAFDQIFDAVENDLLSQEYLGGRHDLDQHRHHGLRCGHRGGLCLA